MAFKQIITGKEARESLKRGVDIGANVARVTIGPMGKNVLIDRGIVTPLVTNDAYKAIQGLVLKDRSENMGLDILKDIVRKTNDTARGARTASIILTQAMFDEGLKHLEPGVNVALLRKEIINVAEVVIDKLKEMSTPVQSIDDIRNIATISSESEEIGNIIASALN